jgi:uncharacterized protein
MHLDLSEIVMRRGMKVGLDVDQPAVEDPDLVFAEPIRGHLVFSNQGDLVNIQGRAHTALKVECGRCLTDVVVPLDLQVEEHFPVDEVQHPNKPPTEDDDLDSIVRSVIYLDQGRPILDLDELLRQLIVMEVPIRTVCSEECAGLCPRCGANRNTDPCQCAEGDANRPLSGLAALLSDGEGADEKGE